VHEGIFNLGGGGGITSLHSSFHDTSITLSIIIIIIIIMCMRFRYLRRRCVGIGIGAEMDETSG